MSIFPDDLMNLVDVNMVQIVHKGKGQFNIVDPVLGVVVYKGTSQQCTDWLFKAGIKNVDLGVNFKVQYNNGEKWVDQPGTIGMTYDDAVGYVDHALKFATATQWRVVQTIQETVYEGGDS